MKMDSHIYIKFEIMIKRALDKNFIKKINKNNYKLYTYYAKFKEYICL